MAIYWTVKIHYADVEVGTSEYNEVAKTTVAALTGYDHLDYTVLSVDEQPEGEPAVQFANGSLQPSRIARRTYTIKTTPLDFASQRVYAASDTIIIMQKPYLWLELNTRSQNGTYNVGATDSYHTANYVIPVTIDGVTVEHDHEHGQKFVTFSFKHRFYNS